MADVSYDEWFKHYEGLLALSHKPIESILELGCGTGAMTQLFAGLAPVVALDFSADMLRIAQEKLVSSSKAIRFVEGNMESFALNERFDACVAVFDVLNCVDSLDGLSRVFDRVAEHLNEGGSFIFDVNTAFPFEQGYFDEDITIPSLDYRHVWRSYYDPKSRLITVDMDFYDGKHHFQEQHIQRAHSIDELKDLLSQKGFTRIYVLDARDMTAPHEESDRWLVSCKMTKSPTKNAQKPS